MVLGRPPEIPCPGTVCRSCVGLNLSTGPAKLSFRLVKVVAWCCCIHAEERMAAADSLEAASSSFAVDISTEMVLLGVEWETWWEKQHTMGTTPQRWH